MTTLLSFNAVTVAYGEAVALSGASLTVDGGEFVTVIGPNGAGKTTLLNAAMGVLPAREGTITFDGQALRHEPPERRVAMGMVIVPERRELFGRLSVEDNLRLGAFTPRARSGNSGGLDRVYDLFPVLAERRRQAAGTLSGGEQQMVALGRALMAQPRILMLDEPSIGLAPRIVQQILAAIATLKASGLTAILVEQNAHLALGIADRAYVLEAGEIVLSGTASALRDDPRVTEVYLGGGNRYAETDPSDD
ncbi:ABC transporter ATP-binding protein [Reyranella sp. CPCC 100927]|uniref:ABC transporter ATP-binding protein n=1 Tax=Reyranella sp. CPCC 100927 TaxID=2599616 RepID=UPI0011B4C103|nr:ABC transporter ATP-binding protein [Reyranella sp. CPCC 100927]TWT12872.1 ABC transporter ATP-binding protein [Reyranella sp. CPCC 100927]